MTPARIALLLDFDGTAYVGDLPIQAYARRLAEQLPRPAATTLIAGMRQFLEGRAVDGAPDLDLSAAEDGYQAVDALAVAAGMDTSTIGAAYRTSRVDLAGSAFAVDPVDGLSECLEEWGSRAHVVLVTDSDSAGVSEVLGSTGLAGVIDEVLIDAGKPGCWPAIIDRMLELVGSPDRILGIGDRWDGDLAPIADRGGWTALVDRFGRQAGHPDVRGPDPASVIPAVRAHAAVLLDRPAP